MAELGYLRTYLPTLYTIPIYLPQVYLLRAFLHRWLVDQLHTLYIHVCVCARARTSVLKQELTNVCLTHHVSAKEVRYPLVAFSLKNNLSYDVISESVKTMKNALKTIIR